MHEFIFRLFSFSCLFSWAVVFPVTDRLVSDCTECHYYVHVFESWNVIYANTLFIVVFSSFILVIKSVVMLLCVQFAVVFYNPFGHNVSTWVRLPVSASLYAVTDSILHPVAAQVSSSLLCFMSYEYFLMLLDL